MRSRAEFIQEYAVSHRNYTNQVIHLVCVPLIYFASAGLLWAIQFDSVQLPLPGGGAVPLNMALLAFIPILLFYARLGLDSFMTGLTWTVFSLAAIVGLEAMGASVVWVCGAIWLAAWVFQFVGHHIEKAKPSFGDDVVFLLIGPLFVQDKVRKLITHRSLSVLRG